MTFDVSSGALFLFLGGLVAALVAWFLRTTKDAYDDALKELGARVTTLEGKHHEHHVRLEILSDRGERR